MDQTSTFHYLKITRFFKEFIAFLSILLHKWILYLAYTVKWFYTSGNITPVLTFTYSSPAVFHPPVPAPLTLLLTNICCLLKYSSLIAVCYAGSFFLSFTLKNQYLSNSKQSKNLLEEQSDALILLPCVCGLSFFCLNAYI